MGWIVLIPVLPALAFAVLVPMSRRMRNRAVWISIAAILASLLLSVAAFAQVWTKGGPGGHGGALYHESLRLASLGGVDLDVGVLLDPTSAVMLLVVTIVGACVQIYSTGYMHRDERIGWYYAVLSLFSAAMLGVVLADGFLLLYMAWEVMGLCSYLLIGFWHEQEGPRKAAMKAFLTTRVGDVGFAIGLAVMYANAGSFAFDVVLPGAASWAPAAATATALLLLMGAMGKSAQVPLHVWLPDAMAGPTPASALIHAATMVAAGVYLVLRALPVFEAGPGALEVTLVVGATTALVGGLLAAVQHDIKKVLAYSTISQLGYMFAALGAAAPTAALFHLVTHAFFKSLLFLGAGVIIHATHTQDMREMGGLARRLPVTTVTFTVGALALAGVVPFSGFWSKDEILAAMEHGHHWLGFAVLLAAAFVTAFYVARLWFRVFTGFARQPHAREGHASMLAPMTLLAAISSVVGFTSVSFAGFLGHEGEWPALGMAALSTAVAASGLALGWWAYGRVNVVLNTRNLKTRAGYFYDALAQKLYFDALYEYAAVRPYQRVAAWLAVFDLRRIDGVVNGVARLWVGAADVSWVFDARVVDGAVNGLARGVRSAGVAARRIQVGRVQSYQRYMLGAVVVLLVLVVVVKGA